MIFFFFIENQANGKHKEFTFGYHSSQIVPYSITDSKRFVKIIVPGIKNIFQHIVIIFSIHLFFLLTYLKQYLKYFRHQLKDPRV